MQKNGDVLRSVLVSGSVQTAIEAVATHFGNPFVTLHLTRNVKSGADNPFVRTTYPASWVSHYLLNNYVAIDPIVQAGMQRNTGFDWSELVLTAAQKAMLRNATAFGIGPFGYTVPTVDEIGRRSLFSVNFPADGTDWVGLLAENRKAFDTLARDLHLKAVAESSIGPDAQSLSPREKECLQWTADGKTYSEIAVILNLSEHTVRSYLKVVRLKLDSVSLAQAVARASNLGLI